MAVAVILALVGCGVGEQSRGGIEGGALAAALDLYSQAKLEEALLLFQEVATSEPDDPDAHAWVAETARRLWQFDLVLSEAELALALDSCHSFAHTVLGDAYRAELSNWGLTDPDSSWAHYQRAVACDPTDGSPWIGMWSGAMRRGDTAMEERALRQLLETRFLTPTVLAFNRWILESVPRNAILITNGDWDTYPALALQLVEGLRPDVGIINRSLLNLAWYANLMSDRHETALPVTQAELESYEPRRTADGSLVILSDHIILTWAELESLSGRPLTFAPTVDMANFEANPRLQFAGTHWALTEDPGESDIDLEACRSAMDAIDGNDLSGSEVSPRDRSAVRRSAARNRSLVKVVLHAAARCATAMANAGQMAEAEEAIGWAENFADGARLEPDQRDVIDSMQMGARGRS